MVNENHMPVEKVQERQLHTITKSNTEIFARNMILSESTQQLQTTRGDGWYSVEYWVIGVAIYIYIYIY